MSDHKTYPIEQAPRGQQRRPLLRLLGWLTRWFVRLVAILWATLAIYYSNLPQPWLRTLAAALFVAVSFAILWCVRKPWPRRAAFWLLWGAIVAWWMLIPPSNDGNWQPDVKVLPWAEIQGNLVTIHNIRNCNYRSETDFDVRHYDAVFDLDKLRSADFFMSHWGSPNIAHTLFSFGFEDDRYLCFSIETRKKVGQDYSTIKGFFKQYELTYIASDERDVIRLRTNYRREQVYLYHLKSNPVLRREVFLSYINSMNSLHDVPEWYNALTSNCTTNIRRHLQPFTHGSWDWRMLLNGHLHELLYERGAVDTTLPQPELKARSLINDRALAADDAADFSRRIRLGLPGIAPVQGDMP